MAIVGRRGRSDARYVGVDIGGSGIKAALVDTTTGLLAGERDRVPTPSPSTPAAVIEAARELIERVVAGVEDEAARAAIPVGVGFPSPVLGGTTITAANVDSGWIGFPAEAEMQQVFGRPTVLGNDADAAGLAEVRFGAGSGRRGVIMVVTIGTGIGSALFVDGCLVPNTELGHIEVRGKDAERRASDAARRRRNLSWDRWAEVFDEYLRTLEHLIWPDLFILGGGTSKRAERFIAKLTVRAPVVPAVLLNDAGIVGAALMAAERLGTAGPVPAPRPRRSRRVSSTEPSPAT